MLGTQVRGTLLAAISPDNTPHGYNLTFAFPMLMFIIIAALLYLRFRSPHRVPWRSALMSFRPPGTVGPADLAGLAGPAHDRTTSGSTLHEGGSEAAGPQGADGPEGTGSAGAVSESEDGE